MTAGGRSRPGKWTSIALLALAEVLAMSVWFTGAAALPELRAEFGLSDLQSSLFTSAVQGGFVVGTLFSALLMLPDRIEPRRLFAVSAVAGAAANLLVLAADPGGGGAIALRFMTGMCMAGVYPVGMRIAATWAAGDMGLLIGLVVGALTLGSASPHLIVSLGGHVEWRTTFALASALALAAAAAILLVGLGSNLRPAARLQPAALLEAWRNRALRLANFGYLGHMWELYAMWAWIGLFLDESFALAGGAPFSAPLATYAVISSGALGCLVGGLLADRYGRTALTIGAMALSGVSAIAAGALFGWSPLLLTSVCLIWGVSIVADSAQFSSCIAELAQPDMVGTMLTLQTCAGFLLTIVTIQVIPLLVQSFGWTLAFGFLAIGPFLGVVAMARLRREPAALQLAGGRK